MTRVVLRPAIRSAKNTTAVRGRICGLCGLAGPPSPKPGRTRLEVDDKRKQRCCGVSPTIAGANRRPDATDAVHLIPPYTECTAASQRRYRAFAGQHVARLPATKSPGPSATGAIDMIKAKAYAAHSASTPMAPFVIERRDPGPDDVQIEILFCGVCHSDLHPARNEWKNTLYPCVPGHEIVGRVVGGRTGVKKFKAGDIAAVGCMVDSCRTLPVLPRRARAVLRERVRRSPTTARTHQRRRSPTAAIRRHRRRRGTFVLRDPARQARPRGRRAAALRRHHDLFAAAALEGAARARRSASSASAASATWA